MSQLRISARTLGSLALPDFCERCFWIRLRYDGRFPYQIPMPGIFSNIDSYVKNMIHSYSEKEEKLPEWFPDIGEVDGYIPAGELHWSRFYIETPKSNVKLTGTPDDVFKLQDNSYHLIDYKVAKITKMQDKLFPLYEVQLNVYAVIAEQLKRIGRGGFSPVSALSLIYLEPQTDVEIETLDRLMTPEEFHMNFKAQRKSVEMRGLDYIGPLVKRAKEIYFKGKPERGREGCEDCENLEKLIRVATT